MVSPRLSELDDAIRDGWKHWCCNQRRVDSHHLLQGLSTSGLAVAAWMLQMQHARCCRYNGAVGLCRCCNDGRRHSFRVVIRNISDATKWPLIRDIIRVAMDGPNIVYVVMGDCMQLIHGVI